VYKRQGVDLRSLGWSGQQLVDVWRDLHPTIAGSRTGDKISGIPIRTGGLWKDFQNAALDIADSGGETEVARCHLSSRKGHLVCRLPSSREIIYREARVDAIVPVWGGMARDTVTFGKVLGAKVIRASQHGGKWVENVVQAICRDLFAEALVRITDRFQGRAGIVLHVHDEIVWEQEPSEKLFEEVVATMVEVPAWATGFPIKAEGFLYPRFVKEPPAGVLEIVKNA
jgi:DNA polymerase